MLPNQVPAHNASGLLPPFVGRAVDRPSCSPYDVTMDYVVSRFATNPVRTRLVRGLIEYRKALYDFGFRSGYQWINGSFVEEAESNRGRAPDDIDVVTIFHRPLRYQTNHNLWRTESLQVFAHYFDRHACKAQYGVESFPIDLDKAPVSIVMDVTYWFSLFSHQKVTNIWKGMLRTKLIERADEYTNDLLLVSQAEGRTNA